VKFIPGDPVALELGGAFDALIGRLVLMYYPDPVDALRRLLRHVRPEGLVVFQEFDFANCRSHPCMPLFDRSVALIRHTLTATGAKPHLGLQLYSVFSNAGLPGPAMRMDAVVGGGPDIAAYDLVAEVIQSLLPTMERLNIATATELQVPTLAQRLRKEVAEARAVVLSPGLIGAWSRRTAAS
jgi:SAM-dependent methyltransferase